MAYAKVEVVVQVDAETVWAEIGAFDTVSLWHPVVLTATSSAGGTTRTLKLKNGQEVVERELVRDNVNHQYKYKYVSGGLPVEYFEGTFTVLGVGGTSRIKWEASYEPLPGVDPAVAAQVVERMIQSAKPGLEARFAGR